MRRIVPSLLLLTILVLPAEAQDTVQVFTGWNIVGSLEAGVIPEILVSVPPGIITTAFYGYSPSTGYESSDTLRKGMGYWVKVSADGIIIFGGSGSSGDCGTKTVDYGGIVYNTVLIAGRCWLKQNLNVGTMLGAGTSQTDNAVLEKHCYDNIESNCDGYGGLYSWNEAMQYLTAPGVQGVCPAGWHVPEYEEFQSLIAAAQDSSNALKKAGVGAGAGAGTNTTGFSALLAGSRTSGGLYQNLAVSTSFWSSTQSDPTFANYLGFTGNGPEITLTLLTKSIGFSVRCVED